MLSEDQITVTARHSNVVVGECRRDSNPKLSHLESGELVIYADGLDNLFDFVLKEMPKPRHSMASSEPGGDDFHTFNTYEEAIDIFRNTPEKVVKFDPAELRVRDHGESGSAVEYDVVGDYIDMGRFMEGVPETWGSMHGGDARNRRVSLMFDLSQAARINEDVVTHRAQRIIRLVDALEAGGLRTELIGIKSTGVNHVELMLKRHDEPLTIADVAVVSHPEFLRRILFRTAEYSNTYSAGYGSSTVLGNAVDTYPELLHPDNNDEVRIFIGSNMASKYSIDDVFDKLERLLVWELSKPVPEVNAIHTSNSGVLFNPNGSRSSTEILREGREVINND